MKKNIFHHEGIGWGQLGVTFCGCFLGAGFVSGQEIWQFFGSFGINGILGLLLAVLLLSGFGYVIITLALQTEIWQSDRLVVRQDIPLLRDTIGGLLSLMYFCVAIIMCAGAAALLNFCFNANNLLVTLGFCLAVGLVSLFGTQGMITSFSVLVPFMTVMTVCFGIIAIITSPPQFTEFATNNDNPLLSNWFLATINFVSYNLFASIGILTPVSHNIKKKSNIYKGMLFGSFLLLAISGSILFAIFSFPATANTELPMLTLALHLNNKFGYIYALLLLCGMFGTSLSCMVALMLYLEQRIPAVRKRKPLVTALILIMVGAGSKIGFGELIGIIYPIFGYVGIAALISIISHFIYIKRHPVYNNK